MMSDNGVMLKTIRNVTPGEPLLMWFTENILAMLNIPFLTPSNIQGKHLNNKNTIQLLVSENSSNLQFSLQVLIK